VTEALGIVNVLIACQPAVDRLAKQGKEAVVGVLAGAGVVQAAGCGAGQSQGVIEFAVGKESGVTGPSRDGNPPTAALSFTVEVLRSSVTRIPSLPLTVGTTSWLSPNTRTIGPVDGVRRGARAALQ
jgi:hypothetical protein